MNLTQQNAKLKEEIKGLEERCEKQLDRIMELQGYYDELMLEKVTRIRQHRDCAVCNQTFMTKQYVELGYKFCPICGKAIDWNWR